MQYTIHRGEQCISDLQDILQNTNYQIFKDHGARFFRVGAGFDIETTNICKWHYGAHAKKIYDFIGAFAYHMQLSLGRHIFLVRKWDHVLQMFTLLRRYAERKRARFLIWIANTEFEFQFIRKRIRLSSVFPVNPREPLYFRSGKLEFRDCLKLTGGGLAYLAKNYCTTKKMVGDLDYSVLRNSSTPLTAEEEKYCINDVAILSEFTEYCLRTYTDNGKNIPYTATGIPRMMVRDKICETDSKKQKILAFVHDKMSVKSKKRYEAYMHFLFRGGFTHANARNINREFTDVYGVDLTSSYPAVMLQSEKFPMNEFSMCRIQTDGQYITQSLDDRCYIFKATFTNIRATSGHCLESKSKIICEDYRGMIFDNGRLYKAQKITVLLTEFDYKNYTMFYDWDAIQIDYSVSAACGRLPSWLLDPLRQLYRRKEQLKADGAGDKRHPQNAEYKIIKGQINSFYGMCCTRLKFVNDKYDLDDKKWCTEANKKKYAHMVRDTFLSPYWGIYISAMARYRLCLAIHAIDPDIRHNSVVYYDTDSIYFIGLDNIREIDAFNNYIETLNTEFSGLGCFTPIEGAPYTRFKTIGAKRYIKQWGTDDIGRIDCVVAGMDGDAYVKKYGDRSFDEFSLYGFSLNSAESNKQISFYVDTPVEYNVGGEIMREESCVCVVDSEFELNQFFLQNIQNFIMAYCQGV